MFTPAWRAVWRCTGFFCVGGKWIIDGDLKEARANFDAMRIPPAGDIRSRSRLDGVG